MPTRLCRRRPLASTAVSRFTSVMLLMMTLALPAADAAPRERHAKRSKTSGKRVEVKAGAPARLPFRLTITPASHPETVIQCAWARRDADFDMEKTVGLKSGCSSNWAEKSDRIPRQVVYLRPTKALTGLTTNVVIETTREGEFLRQGGCTRSTGHGPEDFHGEVHIRTAGAERRGSPRREDHRVIGRRGAGAEPGRGGGSGEGGGRAARD